MAAYAIERVRVAGIASAVPAARSEVQGAAVPDFAKIVANTGVKARHLAPTEVCTSDLCVAAAERLIARLSWDKASIDMVVFVSQTPDYVLPATACSVHGRLGLAKHCSAFDINLGCSGYVYGISVVAAHLSVGAARRALLLVGDTISKVASAEDRSVAHLFGDAGTATALERGVGGPIHFVTGSDGAGAGYLHIPAGMFRARSTEQTRVPRQREGGAVRSDEHLYMNGAEIFNFTIREVPGMIQAVLTAAHWQASQVDAFVLHQANRYMLDYLAKRMKLQMDKVVFALEDFGNTSSASIPLAICEKLGARLTAAPAKLVLAGFGVGFSWAAAALELEQPVIEPVILFSSA